MSSVISGVALAPSSLAATVGNSDPQSGRVVSDDPANFTPHALNGTVNSIAQIGDTMVVGGTFTSVRNASDPTTMTRNRVFAFDATTGVISNSFNPSPNGTVYKVQQTPEAGYAYVAGNFTSAGGGGRNRLFKINVTTGAIDTSFAPPSFDGQIRDLEVTGNRLWVSGKFTHIGGRAQKAMGTLNATTGAYDPYFTGVFAGTHRIGTAGDTTSVLQMATNPTNDTLMAVGNFTSVDGQDRSQIAQFDISGPSSYSLANWATNQYTTACKPAFESYVFDVSYAPDGSYFAVATTGGAGSYTQNMNGTSGCDMVARYEIDSSGLSVRPTWTSYTGGDSTWTIEVTDGVIYAGGHQRYWNNPAGNNAEGQGAVPRPGIAALDPVNGMPWAWNPTRTRGVGIQDFLATPQGLWVGSDTDRIGNYEYHSEIALMPLAGGKELPAIGNANLPNNVYSVASGGSQLVRRSFDGSTAGAASNAPNGSVPWGSTVGAFMVDGVLYTASNNGQVSRSTFDGSTYGTTGAVDTADQVVYQTGWHNEVPSITSLFYYDGEIFYTRSGQSTLFRRAFERDDDIVGQQEFSTAVSGFNFSSMRGAFVANGKFYYSNTTGQLFRADWGGRAPVAGTSAPLVGVGITGVNWASRDLFVYQGEGEAPPPPPVNQPPNAMANVSCILLDCTFTSAGSNDPDGTIDAYDWDFGDGTTPHSTADSTTHTYASPGPRTVTLTLTDNDGDTSTAVRQINPSNVASPVNFVGAAETTGNRTNHTVTVPAATGAGDAMVLFFAANTTTPTYSAPAGWTQLGSNLSAGGMVGRAYYKVATATDHGTTVLITSSGIAKSDMSLAVYSGTNGADPIATNAAAIDVATTASHTSPAVDAPAGSKWLVTYWADKSASTSGWTSPGGQAQRSTMSGTSGGHMSGLLVDSASDVSGSTGGLTATANSVSNVAFSVSLVLQ